MMTEEEAWVLIRERASRCRHSMDYLTDDQSKAIDILDRKLLSGFGHRAVSFEFVTPEEASDD